MAPVRKKIAIACQGGGSHAAFAAGVLQRLLEPDLRERFELIGLSGTSGGAMCAGLTWTGLLHGGPALARVRLQDFWDDLKARYLADATFNFWGVWAAGLPVSSELLPYVNAPFTEARMLDLIERHMPFKQLSARQREEAPVQLLIGATDVRSGERTVFCKTAVTARHLLASAAVPPIFRAIQVDGHHYWDGLFTSNPPIREFTDTAFMPTKPDELWIVQINPQGRDQEPGTLSEMVDRRNELSGNLALAQELHFIEKINQLVADHPSLRKVYQHIECKVVALPPFPGLDYASKLDRRPGLIDDLMAWGREAAPAFLSGAGWTNGPSLTSRSRKVA